MRTFHALVSLSEEKGKSREKQVNGARDTSDSESICYDSPSYEKTLRSPVAHMRADSKIILRRAISFISRAIMLLGGGRGVTLTYASGLHGLQPHGAPGER